MTVKLALLSGECQCLWFNDGEIREWNFLKDSLILDRAKDVDAIAMSGDPSVLSDSTLMLLSSLVEAHEDGDDQNWWDHNYRHLCEVVHKQQ